MRRTVPGKHYREAITLQQIIRQFPDDADAEQWFVRDRWPNGVCCAECGSVNVQSGCKHTTMPYRWRESACGKKLSVKTGSVMEGSKVGYQDWILATFLVGMSLTGVSSMKLYRDLGMTQTTSWFLSMRIRNALSEGNAGTLFTGPVEADESYFGGKRQNTSNAKRKELAGSGRRPAGQSTVVGAKNCAVKQVVATVVKSTKVETLQGFVKDNADPNATVYTDDSTAHETLPVNPDTVKHSLSEYVNCDVHANGIESLLSMPTRAHKGTLQKFNAKHSDRNVQEFAGWHNIREMDTIQQMGSMRGSMEGDRLRHKTIVAKNGLPSGASA